jgi:hypothetical protein
MTKCRVLVTRHLYPEALDMLRAELDVTYHDSRDGLGPASLAAAVAGHQAMIPQVTALCPQSQPKRFAHELISSSSSMTNE